LTAVAHSCDLSVEGEGCMLKSGLTRRIKEQKQHLNLTDVNRLLDAILDEIEAALVRRDRVELRGFGTFFVKTRSARPGRNPKNGAMVSVPERLHPVFKTGKEMHRRLNGTAGSDLRAAFHKGSDAATIDQKA
jgi:integration host factor subunit beta